MTIFLLVDVYDNKRDEVWSLLCNNRNFKEVNQLYGEFNFIVKLEVGDIEERDSIIDSVRKIDGVKEVKVLTGTK